MTNSSRIAVLMTIAIVITVSAVYALVPTSVPTQGLKADGLKSLGHIELVLTDADGNIKAYRQTDNLIVNNGVYATSDKLFGTSLAVNEQTFTLVGVGSGIIAPTINNNDVGGQISSKKTGTVTSVTGSSTGAQIQAFFGAGKLKNGSGTIAITEAGLFDSLTNASGLMYARQTFTAINAGSADSLTVTWSITFADSDST